MIRRFKNRIFSNPENYKIKQTIEDKGKDERNIPAGNSDGRTGQSSEFGEINNGIDDCKPEDECVGMGVLYPVSGANTSTNASSSILPNPCEETSSSSTRNRTSSILTVDEHLSNSSSDDGNNDDDDLGERQETMDPDTRAEKKRQQWDKSIEFLFACVSMSVGLGNVWRFPFTAYDNGGGAFIIPYVVVLIFMGRPLYLLELGLGQFSSCGCVKLWNLSPPFRGIGYAQGFAVFLVASYYSHLIAISFHYLFSSFWTTIPWSVCHTSMAENNTVCVPSGQNLTQLNITDDNVTVVASAEQYFRVGVLKENPDINEGIGYPDPALFGCLALSWILVFLALMKGVQSSGKVSYFTALFPYAVMLIMLVRGLTLPGAVDGVVFLFNPQWNMLYQPKVWYAAVTQSFFSLAVGFGILPTFSSYNKFQLNINRDAFIISIADTTTSLLAAVVTFSIVGNLAHELDIPIDKVVKSGVGMAFITYAEALSKFEVLPQLFAVLFYLMLITLGLGTVNGMISAITTIFRDQFKIHKSILTSVVCMAGCLLGLIYTTPGGQALLQLVDYYGGSLLIIFLGLMEIIAIAWVYKTRRIVKDFKFMMKWDFGIYWKFCWTFFIPVVLAVIFGYQLIFYVPVAYSGVDLPPYAQLAGWLIFMTGVLVVFILFLYSTISYCIRNSTLNPTGAFAPLPKWGPRRNKDREDWIEMLKLN